MTWYRSTDIESHMWVTNDPDDVDAVVEALATDTENCSTCRIEGMKPNHSTTYVRDTPTVYEARTYRCRSFSRWYNPETKMMEGHAHCTCDSCW